MKLRLTTSLLLTLNAAANQCGRVGNHRIVNGDEVNRGSHPWQISLRDTQYSAHKCGGSIIDERWILTAAHCVKRETQVYYVTIGAHEINDAGEGIRKTVKTVVHPDYNDHSTDNDIALLKLQEKIHFGSRVQPICLHEEGLKHPKKWVTISGWGRTAENGSSSKVLREIKVPLVKEKKCRKYYGNRLTENMICAGAKDGMDSCQGDSGGPMSYMDKKNYRWVQMGVVSWGDGCGRKGVPGVYTKVSNYIDWIDEVKEEESERFNGNGFSVQTLSDGSRYEGHFKNFKRDIMQKFLSENVK